MSTMRLGNRAGFAFRDLVAVILLMVIAAGLLVPAVQRTRGDGALGATMNNLSHCAKAVHLAHDNNKKYPPYYGLYGGRSTPYTFHVHLLPFVDQIQLYKQEPPSANADVPAYLSTMDPTINTAGGVCNFALNMRLYYTEGGLGTLSEGANLIYPRMPGSFQKDTTSNTLLFATKYGNCGANGGSVWMDPGNNAPTSPTAATFGVSMQMWQRAPSQAACDPLAGTAVSFTPQSIQVAMCDASIRNVGVGISQATWQAVHTPSAGDVPGGDWDQ
jgi:hypothetical protein